METIKIVGMLLWGMAGASIGWMIISIYEYYHPQKG
jgi:hypothetical protein